MDVLKRFATTKRRMQSLRKELADCEKNVRVVESKLKDTTSFGDIVINNAKYITYSQHVQIYYRWLKTKCLMGLAKDKSDAKWAWFDFQRENDVNYYLENEHNLYNKVIDTWEKSNMNSVISFNENMRCNMSKYYNNQWWYSYPHPTFADYNEPKLWTYSDYPVENVVHTNHPMFTLGAYKKEIKRCEDELCKIKDMFNKEFDKLNEYDYKSDLSCLITKQEALKKALSKTENEVEDIIAEIDSMTNDYEELDTHSDTASVSYF
jgi:hypothetical protein